MTTLVFGFTPDPDDAFAAYAMVHGKVPTPAWKLRIEPAPIDELNRRAAVGELDVAAISSVFYPQLQDSYAILRPGASVGRGYGPVLAARQKLSPGDLAGRRIAVPGETTTGSRLLSLLLPGLRPVPMDHLSIRDAVARGDVDAGVLIHEELLNYSQKRLHKVLCLGAEWERRTALPLPVGLNVVRRDLVPHLGAAMASALRASIEYAIEHPEEAFDWARQFATSATLGASWKFTQMFANEDTVHFGPDCVRGLRELFDRLEAADLAPAVRHLDFVEPRGVAGTTSAAEFVKV